MKPIIFTISIIKLMYMKIIFKQIISILLLSLVLGLFNNYFISDNRVTLIKNNKFITKIAEGSFVIPEFMIEPQEVNTDFVKYYFDNPNTIIIDARDVDQYNKLHIKGSINIPYNYYEDYDILYDLSPDNIYIVYCNGGECSLSLDLAYVMYDEFDFETVFVYEEGLPIWESHNYQVSSVLDNEKELIDNDLESNLLLKGSLLKIIGLLSFLIIYVFFIINSIRDTSKSKLEALNLIVIVSFRFILGYVFIYASIQKIINPIEFSNQIDLYQATPIIFNNLIALIIPWLELLIGLCLILNRNIKMSIVVSILLFIIFIVLLSQAYYRGISLDCGCFGLGVEKTDTELALDMMKRIKEDIVFLCMSFYLYFIYIGKQGRYDN